MNSYDENDKRLFTNDDRADWAEIALRQFQLNAGEAEDDPAGVAFLVADLMHLCDRMGWNIPVIMDYAWYMWRSNSGEVGLTEPLYPTRRTATSNA